MQNQLLDRIEIDDILFLKSVSVDDAESFLNIILKNQIHFARYEFQSPTFTELSDVQSVIYQLIEYQINLLGVTYGLWNQSDLVGLVTINKIDWNNQVADVGIWLTEQATGKAIATKALRSLVHMCWRKLNLKFITAHTAVTNTKCQKLLEKIGFIQSRIIEKHIKVRNKDVDEYQYKLARPD